ncbi:MAG: hypothetical protein GC155_17605 [Alphaproteobacteria bacterium]|nr:hypothetical protein [Alphaproteobacteria bacterium]
MRSLRPGLLVAAAVALGLAAQLAPAQSQVEVRPVEVRPVTSAPAPVTVTPLAVTPSYAPAAPIAAAPLPAPAPAPRAALPAIAAGSPPNVCRPKTAGECAAEAVSCLAARGISDRYRVAGEGSLTGVYSSGGDATQQQAEAAGDCAQDLHRCLAGGC